MRKLSATVDRQGSDWLVTVTDADTGEVFVKTIKAATEKEAAFKAMHEVENG
jgi:hypothetical protein